MKLIGIILIFIVCCAVGFLKALSLKERTAKLGFYSKSLFLLRERIRADSRELSALLPICFEDKVKLGQNGIIFDREHLKKEDVSLLSEFFSALGQLDRRSECERVALFCRLLDDAHSAAEKESAQSSKLYCSMGALSGLAFCIFLI